MYSNDANDVYIVTVKFHIVLYLYCNMHKVWVFWLNLFGMDVLL